jgi:hypothetical protein
MGVGAILGYGIGIALENDINANHEEVGISWPFIFLITFLGSTVFGLFFLVTTARSETGKNLPFEFWPYGLEKRRIAARKARARNRLMYRLTEDQINDLCDVDMKTFGTIIKQYATAERLRK